MDLRITIEDENGDKLLEGLTIYQDGSDAGGVAKIKHWLLQTFAVETPLEDELRELIQTGVEVVEDFLPNIDKCVLQDYGRLNKFLIDAKKVTDG